MRRLKAKAAHRGDGGDLRVEQSGRIDIPNLTDRQGHPQDVIAGVIEKNRRADIRVALRNFNGDRRVDLRQYEDRGTGRQQTAKGFTIPATSIEPLIAALREAFRLARREGLL